MKASSRELGDILRSEKCVLNGENVYVADMSLLSSTKKLLTHGLFYFYGRSTKLGSYLMLFICPRRRPILSSLGLMASSTVSVSGRAWFMPCAGMFTGR